MPPGAVATLDDLRNTLGTRLRGPEGDRDGQRATAMNAQHRIAFDRSDGPARVKMTDHHR